MCGTALRFVFEAIAAAARGGAQRKDGHCTVGSDEKFQIRSKKIFFEISGPGPSYTSLGTSQDHIWSYFDHMC